LRDTKTEDSEDDEDGEIADNSDDNYIPDHSTSAFSDESGALNSDDSDQQVNEKNDDEYSAGEDKSKRLRVVAVVEGVYGCPTYWILSYPEESNYATSPEHTNSDFSFVNMEVS